VTDETDRELVAFLERAVGDGLRAAGVTTDDGYEILFVRDDVVEKLAADGDFRAAADEIADGLVFRELEREYQRRLFGLGDRRCSVGVFDDGVVFLFPEDLEAKRGALVSVDRGVDVSVPSFVAECRARLPWD
jgi:hypothetical protein